MTTRATDLPAAVVTHDQPRVPRSRERREAESASGQLIGHCLFHPSCLTAWLQH